VSGKRFKHKRYLEWAKRQGGDCCVCRALTGDFLPCDELHHFDYANRGTGMKGRDHWVCRLCLDHHKVLQGKSRTWFVMNDELETWTAMIEDAVNLLSDYVLVHKGNKKEELDCF
jgi:hypothetical protein